MVVGVIDGGFEVGGWAGGGGEEFWGCPVAVFEKAGKYGTYRCFAFQRNEGQDGAAEAAADHFGAVRA